MKEPLCIDIQSIFDTDSDYVTTSGYCAQVWQSGHINEELTKTFKTLPAAVTYARTMPAGTLIQHINSHIEIV